jgi:molecular chaperone GrpE
MKDNNENPAESSQASSQEPINNTKNPDPKDAEISALNAENKNLQDKISELEKKFSDLNEKLLRSLAEAENIRRRGKEENEKTAKYAIVNFANDLVVVVENFFMASENSPREEIAKNPIIQNYAKAMEMTQSELLKILEKNNIKRIFPLNQIFDHNLHEAIVHLESELAEGTVVQVIQAGYSIGDRLIKPAMVGVAKAKNN